MNFRYLDLESGLEEENHNVNQEYTLAKSVHSKKKKENTDKTMFINGINANSTPNSGIEGNASLMDSNHMDTEPPVVYYGNYLGDSLSLIYILTILSLKM